MINIDIQYLKNLLHSSVDSSPDRIGAFFKKGIGDYAQHDKFIGISVPALRKIAKQFGLIIPSHTFDQTNVGRSITLNSLAELISSEFNEERLLALIILTQHYKSGSLELKDKLYQFYIQNLQYVNNWNLVDSSAHLIIGAHIYNKDRSYLAALAKSPSIWERRIAIVATLYFIRKGDLTWTFKIAQILLNDKHDLIHKAVGWMLREAGKQNTSELIQFLQINANKMPRTMLRYAIEKFSYDQRKSYLQNKYHTY